MALDETADEALNAKLLELSEYPAYATTFNADRTLAAVTDDVMLHIIDLATGDDLFQLEDPYAIVAFSSDSKLLYASSLKDPSGSDFSEATFSVYSVPDGKIIKSQDLPAVVPYPSADDQHIVVMTVTSEVGSEEVGVLDLDTGLVSPLLLAADKPTRVTQCSNSDTDLSDYDYTTSGHLWLIGLYWLKDSTGFVTFNSQDGTTTSTGCMLDYSRLRQYSITG
jgi:hypothetical protein